MPSVACPSCGEKGRIPHSFIGIRIKCKKCGNSFLVTPPVAKAAVAAVTAFEAPAEPIAAGIAVEGLAPSTWSASEGELSEARADHEHEPEHGHEDASAAFTASHAEEAHRPKQYKVLSQKDKWFEGKFDLGRLEEALNHYASEGWVVRSMATPQVASFAGGTKEEIVILLER